MFETRSRTPRCRKADGEQGFTLIELLIVIVVLGILAAIVVFALGGVTSSSAAAACTTDAQSVAVAVAAEQAQLPNTAPIYATGTTPGDLAPTYLASLPSNSAYVISLTSAHTVQVALVANDPGTVNPSGVTGPGVTPQNYNSTGGVTIYKYPSGFPSPEANAGICAGA